MDNATGRLSIEELSGAPSVVLVVRAIVRAIDSGEARDHARRARLAGTAQLVHAIGAARLREAGLLEPPDIGDWLRPVVESALHRG